jgi:hypothetical protein
VAGTRTLARRALYEGRSLLSRNPWIATTVARRRGAGHGQVFDSDTEFVIEGYPRSGNTFAVAAFQQAQPRDVRVAHHVHASGHVIAALDAGLPVLVLIREPEDAVLGWVLRRGYITTGQALRSYRRFYASLLPYRNRLVVGAFGDVTTDFGQIIRRVNERFGTRFAEFEHTEEAVASLFQAMEWYRTSVSKADEVERLIGRPSPAKGEMKDAIRATYRAAGLRRSREAAERLFRDFTTG